MKPQQELLTWLNEKLAAAEKALTARNEMAQAWREGDDESWKAVGCFLNKSLRIKASETQERIALKCLREVEMFKATIEAIESK